MLRVLGYWFQAVAVITLIGAGIIALMSSSWREFARSEGWMVIFLVNAFIPLLWMDRKARRNGGGGHGGYDADGHRRYDDVNPSSGLPMIDRSGIDVGGNSYGTNRHD